ncbi:MAG: insulinase family protein, partial [Paludibacteraceae bacterium]|nr:insulinase family protein [Paludibacteraceae bacterium]
MKKLFIMFAAAVMAVTAMAQENPMMKPVPMDPEVRYGHLPNGLTYYVRHNETPKNRCEFHIAQAVGAILEEDHQNGLAHFLEHMCFNGTEHFPGKKIIEYFESKGVSFGGDINAYTSLDETVYRLSNVPTTNPAVLDSALLVLYDWSCAVSLLGEEIDNERGVIREEWRTGNSA